jgi:hypothetical protein
MRERVGEIATAVAISAPAGVGDPGFVGGLDTLPGGAVAGSEGEPLSRALTMANAAAATATPPTAISAFRPRRGGVVSLGASGSTSGTRIVTEPSTPSAVAVTTASPGALIVTTPPGVTDATPGSLERQLIHCDSTAPRGSAGVARRRKESPTARLGGGGEIVTEATGDVVAGIWVSSPSSSPAAAKGSGG